MKLFFWRKKKPDIVDRICKLHDERLEYIKYMNLVDFLERARGYLDDLNSESIIDEKERKHRIMYIEIALIH